ncbi:MAG: hypothetical protein A3F41_03090 [Coxiella sp. RIFCSPHIGHO2_12_FULL_44_14]|nr:MAG: hypothetical protein A3F41_03090 [Coxiella sp. RIFCSPHIGHO2_12_FULL_44_14]
MVTIPPSYRSPLIISIALHIVFFIVLFVVLPKNTTYRTDKLDASQVNIVHAVTVDPNRVEAEVAELKQQQAQKMTLERDRLHQLQQAALAAEQQRIEEQRRVAELKAEQVRLEEQERARDVLKKQRAEREQMRREKEQQIQRALLEKQQKLQQTLLTQQMAEEQRTLSAAHNQALQGLLDQYKAQIIQAIQRQWIVPPNSDRQSSCLLLVRVGPGGVVLDAAVVRSSGDPVLDRSAQTAVFKASPLPVPKDPAIFDQFRELRLTVRPLSSMSRES